MISSIIFIGLTNDFQAGNKSTGYTLSKSTACNYSKNISSNGVLGSNQKTENDKMVPGGLSKNFRSVKKCLS